MRYAIVIGVDEYGGVQPQLQSAVADAETFRDWLLEDERRGYPRCDRVYTLLGRRADAPGGGDEKLPTKDNVVGAINDVMAESEGVGEALYFFFSGHGLTTTYAQREESALVFPGNDVHPFRTLAVRSIAEFFETTRFQDQFFFIDACRSPLDGSNDEIGAWPIPRKRAPGQEPVQQFILYATSPGRPAESAVWPDELSAFTDVLMQGLRGAGRAKAWSWERNRYEVRWDRLAGYVKDEMEHRRLESGEPPEGGWPFQIPQDVGIRGVARRDRDALLSRPRGAAIEERRLTLELDLDGDDEVDVTVVDAIGGSVASALRVTERSQDFTLPPRTYAARATTAAGRVGRLAAPVELYDDETGQVEWVEAEDPDEIEDPYADGTIEIASSDPFAVADIRDETGWVVGVATVVRGCDAPPGFYKVRLVGPERTQSGREQLALLRGGKTESFDLEPATVDSETAALAEAVGGRVDGTYVVPAAGAAPAAWAQPSTVAVAAVGAALHGDQDAIRTLGLEVPLPEGASGVALVAAPAHGGNVDTLQARLWPAGRPVPAEADRLEPAEGGIASLTREVDAPAPHWLSIEPEDAEPTVLSLPVLEGRLATVVAQVEPGGLRLYEFHPPAAAADASAPDWLRREEQLQRQLLGGRMDGAEELALAIRGQATADPFGACLAGYVLLRLGLREGLGELASAIIQAAPTLADAYILRGEYEAYMGNQTASDQAFAEAVSTGVPAFGEGLTRLVEGLRASGFFHPRGTLVRYVFQRHARGTMWSAFTPRRTLEPGTLAITGADIGYEG